MKIFLRPIELKDGDLIVKWRNDEKVLAHCMNKQRVTLESNETFYRENIIPGKYKQFIVERIEENFGLVSYPIATVYLKDMDYSNKKCELCIFTSNDEEWGTEGQIIAIQMLLDKAFKEFGMHKVYSYVFKKFPDEIELLKEAGFKIEATLLDEAENINGGYDDVLRLSIYNV